MAKLRVLDLFSGIGGFSLGLERTGGFETVAFCEIEKYPQKILKKHWPGVPIFEDVRKLKGEEVGEIDVITGGFPCQDLSTAGLQAGIGGERSGLFSEIIRLTGELRPSFVIMENVANLIAGPSNRPGEWFGEVLGALASIRFDAEWEVIPLSAFGAPQDRSRVWIVAYPQSIAGIHKPVLNQAKKGLPDGFFAWPACPWRTPEAGICRVDDGIPNRVDRTSSLGNAVGPVIPEMIGHAILQSIAAE